MVVHVVLTVDRVAVLLNHSHILATEQKMKLMPTPRGVFCPIWPRSEDSRYC